MTTTMTWIYFHHIRARHLSCSRLGWTQSPFSLSEVMYILTAGRVYTFHEADAVIKIFVKGDLETVCGVLK